MLDASVRADILNLMVKMRETKNTSYLFITHDLSLAWLISDRVAIMYLGQMVELAAKQEFFDHPLHPYTQALLSAIPVPDPTKERNRILLEGDVPSPQNPPSGCRFHTRCRHAMDRCRQEIPRFSSVGNDHFVACFLHQK